MQTTDNQQKHVKLTVKRHNRICITEIEYNLTILCENNDHEPGLLSLFGKGYCTVKSEEKQKYCIVKQCRVNQHV